MDAEDRKPGNFVKSGPMGPADEGADMVRQGSQPETGTTESTPRGMGSAKPNAFPAGAMAFKRPLP